MRGTKSANQEIWLLVFGIAIAALLGSPFDLSLVFISIVMFAVVCFWIFQIRRLISWISRLDDFTPESFGVWGALYDSIYRQVKVNERFRARLQSSIDYLRSSYSSVRDAVVMIDKSGAIEWCNESASEKLGLRYPEDEGKMLLNLLRDPEFGAYFLSEEYEEPLSFEFNSAEDIHMEVEVSRFGKGNTLLFFRDVTSRVRVDRIRRDFASNVSHELRTPLTVIKGYVQTVLDNPGTSDVKIQKALVRTDAQISRMENLISDLLWLARIERKRGRKHGKKIDVKDLLAEIHESLMESHSGRLKVNINSSACIYGNHRELYSAVSNLVLNALNYSDDEKAVEVTWYKRDDRLRLDVADSGLGIESSHIPRLTERFYRVDESRTLETGGTGLGLAIVKHVAVSHDAQLEIQSELGVGSCFSLVFPNIEQ